MSREKSSRVRRPGIRRVDLAHSGPAASGIARDINRDVILELIRKQQPITRVDLTRLSGLQPSTTSAIVEELLWDRWITEGARAQTARGRKPSLLTMNAQMLIAAVDLRPSQAILALIDINGRCLSSHAVPIGRDPVRGMDSIADALEKMILQSGSRSIEGVGISLPGRVDPETQRLIFAPNLPWIASDLKAILESRVDYKVEMDNAANACLLAELWFGKMDGVRDAVLVTISEGIGTAIVANGQITMGKRGLAGEFGHTIHVRDGELCGCGRRGCWEMYASSRAALRYHAELSPDKACASIMELMTAAENNEPKAMEALTRQAEYLGEGLARIVSALAPEMILLTGGITLMWPRFSAIVQRKMEEGVLAGEVPRIVVAAEAELGRLKGAAALVLQRHSGLPATRAAEDAVADLVNTVGAGM